MKYLYQILVIFCCLKCSAQCLPDMGSICELNESALAEGNPYNQYVCFRYAVDFELDIIMVSNSDIEEHYPYEFDRNTDFYFESEIMYSDCIIEPDIVVFYYMFKKSSLSIGVRIYKQTFYVLPELDIEYKLNQCKLVFDNILYNRYSSGEGSISVFDTCYSTLLDIRLTDEDNQVYTIDGNGDFDIDTNIDSLFLTIELEVDSFNCFSAVDTFVVEDKCNNDCLEVLEFKENPLQTCDSINLRDELSEEISNEIQWYELIDTLVDDIIVSAEIENEYNGCDSVIREFYGVLTDADCQVIKTDTLEVHFYPNNLILTFVETSACTFVFDIEGCEDELNALVEIGYYHDNGNIVINEEYLVEQGLPVENTFYIKYQNLASCTYEAAITLNCSCDIVFDSDPIDEINCGNILTFELPEFIPPNFVDVNVYYSIDSLVEQSQVYDDNYTAPLDSSFYVPEDTCFITYYFYARVDEENQRCKDYKYLGKVEFYQDLSKVDIDTILCHNSSIDLPQLGTNVEWVYSSDSITNTSSDDVTIYNEDLLQGGVDCDTIIYYFQARLKDCRECESESKVFNVRVKPRITIDVLEENIDGGNCELNIITCPSNEVYINNEIYDFENDYTLTPGNESSNLTISVINPECREKDTTIIYPTECFCPTIINFALNDAILCSGDLLEIMLDTLDASNTDYPPVIKYYSSYNSDITEYKGEDLDIAGEYYFTASFETANENCQSSTDVQTLIINQSPAAPEIDTVSAFLSGCEYRFTFPDTSEFDSINLGIEIDENGIGLYNQELLEESDTVLIYMSNESCDSLYVKEPLTCVCPKPIIFLKDTIINLTKFPEPLILICDLGGSIVNSYQWYKNDTIPLETYQFQVIDDSIEEGNYTEILKMYSVKVSYRNTKCSDFSSPYRGGQTVEFLYPDNFQAELYPNPVRNNLLIRLNKSIEDEVLQIEITHVDGAKVWLSGEINEAQNRELSFDLSLINSGMYFVSIYQNNEILETHKIIKL